MRRLHIRRFPTILRIHIEKERICLIVQYHQVAKSEHQAARIEIVARRRQVNSLDQRQEIRHVAVGQIDLLAHAMVAYLFVQPGACPRVVGFRVEVKGSFELDQDRRRGRWELKIQLPAFKNALSGSEEENLVLADRPTYLDAWVVAQQERSVSR